MKRVFLLAGLAASALSAGCTTDAADRHDGVSFSAGNAIAANTAMQMVDPWPAGIEQTHLEVPADLDQYRKGGAVEASAGSESGSIVSD